jgi:hypothetical protein
MPPASSPYVRYALAKAVKKGEDLVCGLPTLPWPTGPWRPTAGPRTYGLYAVIDGHNGVAAAEYTAAELPTRFADELVKALTAHDGCREDAVQAALGATFLALDAEFCARGVLSGATCTVMVQMGWHVTVANIGDSRAILDAGGSEVRVGPVHACRQACCARGARRRPRGAAPPRGGAAGRRGGTAGRHRRACCAARRGRPMLLREKGRRPYCVRGRPCARRAPPPRAPRRCRCRCRHGAQLPTHAALPPRRRRRAQRCAAPRNFLLGAGPKKRSARACAFHFH